MVTKYKDLLTGEDVVFNKYGGLTRAPNAYNGQSTPGVLKFARGALTLLTPQQLIDLAIEPYEYTQPDPVVSTDPADYPLTRRQLRLGLLEIGLAETAVLEAINEIEDATERAVALIDWQDADNYNFDHPLVKKLISKVGIPQQTVIQAWLAAKDR